MIQRAARHRMAQKGPARERVAAVAIQTAARRALARWSAVRRARLLTGGYRKQRLQTVQRGARSSGSWEEWDRQQKVLVAQRDSAEKAELEAKARAAAARRARVVAQHASVDAAARAKVNSLPLIFACAPPP